MSQSVGRAGSGYDIVESLRATLKKELVHDQHFRTHDEARAAILNDGGYSIIKSESTAHSATSAPKRSRRPRRSKRNVIGAPLGVQVHRAVSHTESRGPV
jgi:hypothetical protein